MTIQNLPQNVRYIEKWLIYKNSLRVLTVKHLFRVVLRQTTVYALLAAPYQRNTNCKMGNKS